MGRHVNADCFYLCQTFARIPKHLVRDNVYLLVLFRQDERNLKHVYEDHVNTDMTYTQFRDKYGFVFIDKDSELTNGRYRKGFDCFVIL